MTIKPIIAAPFAGGHYMCVEASLRHQALNRANHAFNLGDRELAEDLKQEALTLPGCAFEVREREQSSIVC